MPACGTATWPTRGSVMADANDLATVANLRETQALLKELRDSESEQKTILMTRLGEGGDMLIDPETGKPLVTWKLGNGPRGFALDEFQLGVPRPVPEVRAAGQADAPLPHQVKEMR